MLIVGAIAFEVLALAHIFIGDKLDALVLLSVMIGLAIAVRALGYHKIIFNQRRNTVMQKVQSEGLTALETMTSLTNALAETAQHDEAIDILKQICECNALGCLYRGQW